MQNTCTYSYNYAHVHTELNHIARCQHWRMNTSMKAKVLWNVGASQMMFVVLPDKNTSCT